MSDFDHNELEKISDYSLALVQEISKDIESLNKYIGRNDNNLDEINRKIDLARGSGVNVDSLDQQIQEFRVKLFKRQIKHKIEDLNNNEDNYFVDSTKIQREYNELQKEKGIDLLELEQLMNDFSAELTRALIKHMINNFKKSGGISAHSIDKIADEIFKAKEKGIRVDDIEEMLFEE